MTATGSRALRRAAAFGRIALGALVISAMAVVIAPTAASAATATYSSTSSVGIPDAVGGDCNTNTSDGVATSTISVPDAGSVSDLQIALNISHTYQSDLIVDLTSPGGTTIRLIDRVNRTINCGSANANIVATLSDASGASIENYGAAGASYSPMQALSAFDGETITGDWVLTVRDASTFDVGVLNSWSLQLPTSSDFAVADITAGEGDGAAVFTVTRTGPTSDAETIDYTTADGTATAGSDYTATSGTLAFAPNQTSATVSVPLLDDDVHEGDETFALELSNPVGTPTPTTSAATATATIAENDARPELSIADASASEDDASVVLTVTRTGATGGADSVDFSTADGTATAGTDYVATGGTLAFAPGAATATITVPLLDDDVHEGDETFTVELANPASSTGLAPTIGVGTAAITVVENDTRADLAIADATVAENAGSVTLTVTRIGALGGTDSVAFATANGTARAGVQFTAASGTLVFAPGEDAATITVPILADSVNGASRDFTVVLSDASGTPAPTVSVASATVTITDASLAALVVAGSGIAVPVAIALLLLAAGAAVLIVRRVVRGRSEADRSAG